MARLNAAVGTSSGSTVPGSQLLAERPDGRARGERLRPHGRMLEVGTEQIALPRPGLGVAVDVDRPPLPRDLARRRVQVQQAAVELIEGRIGERAREVHGLVRHDRRPGVGQRHDYVVDRGLDGRDVDELLGEQVVAAAYQRDQVGLEIDRRTELRVADIRRLRAVPGEVRVGDAVALPGERGRHAPSPRGRDVALARVAHAHRDRIAEHREARPRVTRQELGLLRRREQVRILGLDVRDLRQLRYLRSYLHAASRLAGAGTASAVGGRRPRISIASTNSIRPDAAPQAAMKTKLRSNASSTSVTAGVPNSATNAAAPSAAPIWRNVAVPPIPVASRSDGTTMTAQAMNAGIMNPTPTPAIRIAGRYSPT